MNSHDRRLLRAAKKLDEGQREQLLAFAEFLGSRPRSTPAVCSAEEPNPLPRREGETVVGAIRRLRETYHMLDARSMLNETAALMSQHALGGAPAHEVIAELEIFFSRSYAQYRASFQDFP